MNYEGQAAIELEAAADPSEPDAYPLPGTRRCSTPRETIGAILGDLGAGVPVATVAARFHNAVAEGAARASRRSRARRESSWPCSPEASSRTACCWSGPPRRSRAGLRVLVPRLLPPNDGGIAFGQAAVAAAAAL